jgi:hypothetical protein
MKEIRALKPVKNAWLVRGLGLERLQASEDALYGKRIVWVTPIASTSVTDISSTRTT